MKKINWKEIQIWKKIPKWKGIPKWQGIPKGKGKKILVCAGAGIAAAAIVAGIVLGTRGNGKTVDVYPFAMVGMTEYWGDNQESYGPVTTDKIQTVFLSDTQIITGIPVEVGAHVKKGDVLMTYDTTLSELELERKRLDVEKAKLQVTEAEEELRRINQLKPSSGGGGGGSSDPDTGRPISGAYEIRTDKTHDGKSEDNAIICWLRSDTQVNNSILRALYYEALSNRTQNVEAKSSASEMLEEGMVTEPPTTPSTEEPVPPTTEETEPQATTETVTEPQKQPMEETPEPTTEPQPQQPSIFSPHLLNDGDTLTVNAGGSVNLTFLNRNNDDTTWALYPKENTQLIGKPSGNGFVVYGFPTEIGEMEYRVEAMVHGAPTASFHFTLKVVESSQDQKAIDNFYVVFKQTADDTENAMTTWWQGIRVYVYNRNVYGFMPVFNVPSESELLGVSDDDGGFSSDFGSGMTSAEITQMRREQTKKVRDLYEAAQMAESEYNLMEREFNDGNVRADLDGEVVSVLTEDEARQNKQPIIKVSGGGGFYVTGSVSELEKDNLKIGQSVTVNDWNTGNIYDGQVVSIGDFPVDGNGWNGLGNPNASYYPFRVFIDGSADLQENGYVSITYSAAQAQNGVYLENPYLRTDDGEPYVYVRGAHGKLEKRYVTTGKSLWGTYTEIRSGLTADDYVAFPYGKNVKPGAGTQEGDPSTLYNF